MLKIGLLLSLFGIGLAPSCCDQAKMAYEAAQTARTKAEELYDACYRHHTTDFTEACSGEDANVKQAETNVKRASDAVGKECHGIDPL